MIKLNRTASVVPKFVFHKKTLPLYISTLMIASASAVAVEDDVGFLLEEVVVTAQKRAENLQDVPIAVSAFSQDALLEQGILSGTDLKLSVPNVSFNDLGFGQSNFQVRGIGSFIIGPTADAGVGIHQNNIPLQNNRLPTAEFYDVERVEVLRGPQGTLYGRNATGGVVNILSAKPKDEFSSQLTAEVGNYNAKRVRGHINVPLTEQVAFRLAGSMVDHDGTIENAGTRNDVDSRDIWSTRATLRWQSTNSFYAEAMWETFRQDDSSGANQVTLCAPAEGPTTVGSQATDDISRVLLTDNCENIRASDSRSFGVANSLGTLPGIFNYYAGVSAPNYFEGATVSRDIRTINRAVDPFLKVDNDLFSVEFGFDITDTLSFTSVSAYNEDNMDLSNSNWGATPTSGFFIGHPLISPDGVYNDPNLGPVTFPANQFYVHRDTEQVSQELRLQSSYDGKLNFSLGALYMQYEMINEVINYGTAPNQFAQLSNFSGQPEIIIEGGFPASGAGHNYFNSRTDYELTATAVFGELYYDISDKLKLTTGLRYTKDEKVASPYPVQFLQPGFGFSEPNTFEETFEELTGRITLDWKVTEDSLIYASYAKGYKGGGINPSLPEGIETSLTQSFAPEFVNAFEIGSKSIFANGRLSFNTSLFHYDYEGYQVAKTAFQTVFTENIDAQLQGLELELVFQATDYLRINSQIGFLDTEIDSGQSIDPLNKNQGSDDMVVVRDLRPGGGIGQTCLVPEVIVESVLAGINGGAPSLLPFPTVSPSANVGLLCGVPGAREGDAVSLAGKELPYSASWTASIGAELDIALTSDWSSTLRADYFIQDDTYARIYNAAQDEIDGYDNLNISYQLESESAGVEIMFYARNLLSKGNIVTITAQGDNVGDGLEVGGKQPAFYGVAFTKRWQ